MASPIVVCPPHLKSLFFTTHRKQEAVCNPLKLEYARLSLTRTVGEEAYPKHRWTAFVPLCSVLFLLYFRIIFSFDFYILKSFLGHSDQNTFLPLLLLLLLPHFPACVSLYFHPRAESKEKKSRGVGVDDFTVTCAHGFYSTKTTRRSRSISASALIYIFFCSHILLVDPVIICSSLGECDKKRRNWLVAPFRERDGGRDGDTEERACIWMWRGGC